MGLFTRYNPLDRIYICPIQYEQKQLPEGQEAYLFCDSKGNLTTAIVETSVLESARNAIKQLRYEGKGGAILCIEIATGQSATFAVEINAEQAEALAQIHQLAIKSGVISNYLKIPDHLKKYPAQIIKIGESMRGEIKKQYEQIARSLPIPETPGLQEHCNPLDRIYICPIQYEHEQLREGLTRVLFCDSKGNLTTEIIQTSTSEFVQDAITQLDQAGKAGAVLSIEVAPGQSATFAVEMSAEQAEALAQITQLAFETGTTETIPDYLRKYVAQIIKLGESRRKEFKEEYERGTQGLVTPARPELREQLASKFDAPIRYAEPNAAIILERLPPNEQTRPGMQRVLILDYRGIFCTVRIPVEALDDAEKELEQRRKTHNDLGVIVFSTNEEGFLMGPMGITEPEKEALDMVKQYLEAIGRSMDAIPTDVKTILARASALLPARNSENANS